MSQCQGFSGSHTCRCKEHKIDLELNIGAVEQYLMYFLLTYGFLVSYNKLRQSYLELEFARANFYIIIFKEISGSSDKVSYGVGILYTPCFSSK